MPNGIIADCQLRWPESLGRYAFVSGVTVTRRLVTVTFVAATDPVDGGTLTSLASIALPQPVAALTSHPLNPSQPGVAGSIVFGDLRGDVALKFAGPSQSLLVSRAASPYPAVAIEAIGKQGRRTALAGDVLLDAGTDIRLSEMFLDIDGQLRRAIVIALAESVDGRNVFSEYLGPCDKRPESRNCDVTPVETLGGVVPDCDGNINIVFEGLSTASYSLDDEAAGGFVLDADAGLPDVCPPRPIDYYTGEDQCEASVAAEESESVAAEEADSLGGPCRSLPINEDFAALPADWVVTSGEFSSGFAGSSSSASSGDLAYNATSLSRRNVAVVPLCNSEIRVGVVTRCRIWLEDSGDMHNGGLILNYKPGVPVDSYFAVVLDWERSSVRILRFSNGNFIAEDAVVTTKPIFLETWYRMEVTITQPSPTTVSLAVTVIDDEDPFWPEAALNLTTGNYGTPVGEFGVGSNRGAVVFDDFEVEAI